MLPARSKTVCDANHTCVYALSQFSDELDRKIESAVSDKPFRTHALHLGAAACSFSRRSNCAFAATMMVERLIATAPTLIGRSSPHLTRRPPATGMATRLYAVAQTRF